MVYLRVLSPEKMARAGLAAHKQCVDVDLRKRRPKSAEATAGAGKTRTDGGGGGRARGGGERDGALLPRAASSDGAAPRRPDLSASANALRAKDGVWRGDEHAKFAFAAYQVRERESRPVGSRSRSGGGVPTTLFNRETDATSKRAAVGADVVVVIPATMREPPRAAPPPMSDSAGSSPCG